MRDRLKRFIDHLEKNPILPLTDQECCGLGKDFWCADWWTREVATSLFLGEKDYLARKIPNYLKDNRHFSPKSICGDAVNKVIMLDILRREVGRADDLLVCEVGRGLDILLAEVVKNWRTIYCYDSNRLYEKFLVDLWGDKIKFTTAVSSKFDLSILKGKTIALTNHSRSLQLFSNLKICENIVCAIKDGEVIK